MFSKNKNIYKLSPPDEEEFKKLVELLPEIVARTDRELKITFLNKNGLKVNLPRPKSGASMFFP
jgi:hypothetical protein